jgi:hypothetical protein
MKIVNNSRQVQTIPLKSGKMLSLKPGEPVDLPSDLDRKSVYVQGLEHAGAISIGGAKEVAAAAGTAALPGKA